MSDTSGDTKPTSFDDPSLVWEDSAPTPHPAPPPASNDPQTPDTATDSTPASATETPATGTTPGETPREASGPIPLDRHQAVLAAERQKRTELEAKWQRVLWAETLVDAGKSPEQIRDALSLFDSIDSNPMEFLGRFYDLLGNHPTLGPQVKSWAGKVLGAGPQALAADDPEPSPDFQDAQGTPFFSAPQLQKWQAWSRRQDEAKFNQRLDPLFRAQADRERAAQQAQQDAREVARVHAEVAELANEPHFAEMKADMLAYIKANNWKPSVEKAYRYVLTTKILPNLNSTARAGTIAALKTQAAASSVKPSAAASANPSRPKSFDDPNLEW